VKPVLTGGVMQSGERDKGRIPVTAAGFADLPQRKDERLRALVQTHFL